MARAGISFKRFGAVAALTIFSAVLLASPQLVAAEEPAEESPPVISNGILTPGILSFEGGSVSIGVDVVDDTGVSSVYAEVIGSNGTYYSVGMSPSGGASYSASVDIPPNFAEGEEVSYSFYVWAADTDGISASELIGDIQVPAPPQFDEAPAASDPSVQPRELPASGGAVTIQATATDNRAVSAVYATIALPGGGSAEVPLEPISSSRFEGVFEVPPNAGTTTLQYGVQITALDDIGQPDSVDAGLVSVLPPPSSAGQLRIRPEVLSFGPVRVGKQAWRFIRVRNLGPRSTKPIEGLLQTSGAPFSLPGGDADGVHFRLRPHETKVFAVEFRPLAVGLQAGSVTIVRSDGAQPGLATSLSGWGLKRSRSRP